MQLTRSIAVCFILTASYISCNGLPEQWNGLRLDWSLGPCTLQIFEPCNNSKIRFLLYTEGRSPVELQPLDPDPPPEMFNPSYPTVVVIHGYAGHAEFNTTAVIRRAYLNRGEYNVIVVDWGPLANHPCFFTAVINVWQAGKCTSQLLTGLANKFNLRMADVHAVGFSLGSHVAAIASNGVRDSLGIRLGRITGLDPALPLFATLYDGWKLDPDDADFVDAIHTNVGVFGKIEAVGHADFFVNGGTFQPACAGHRNVPLCSHLLAPVYFAESVSSKVGFWGAPCPSIWYILLGFCSESNVPEDKLVLMGEPCSNQTRGIFYLDTSDSPPYALGKRRNRPTFRNQHNIRTSLSKKLIFLHKYSKIGFK